MADHTALPWHVEAGSPLLPLAVVAEVTSSDTRVFVCGTSPILRSEEDANAAFIVRAVNGHDALLEACKEAWAFLGGHAANPAIGRPLAAAIEKAEGK